MAISSILLLWLLLPHFSYVHNQPAKLSVDLFLPNKRASLNELRFYKYGVSRKFNCRNIFPKHVPKLSTKLKEFPHVAAIGWKETDGHIEWDCGGSLITEKFVMTAAHCTRNENDLPPNIIRLGQIILTDRRRSGNDDEHVQEFKIKNIIPHPQYSFNARYFDIALFELEGEVKLTDAVCPACLWNDDDIYFQRLVAAGYGATGFDEPKSGKLLKLSLNPISLEQCHETYHNDKRKLPKGLNEKHFCALDPILDTCQGDSGGPLQDSLYAFGKMNPFIVGIISFGKACGSGTPGVYTKVSSYIDWVESIVNTTFKPAECAFRYQAHRPKFFLEEIDESLTQTWYDIFGHKLKPTVFIIFPHQNKSFDCTGSMIDYNYVLTSAQCTTKDGREPIAIEVEKVRYNILKTIRHPNYREGYLYDNIALLQIEKTSNIFKNVLPVILLKKQLPHLILAKFLKLVSQPDFPEYEPALSYFYTRQSNNCSRIINSNISSRLPNGLKDTQMEICLNDNLFMVPNTCHMERVDTDEFRGDRYLVSIIGINSIGGDCGFGRNSVVTKLTPYYDWIESVILKTNSSADKIIYRDDEVYEGDTCHTANDQEGLCVLDAKCSQLIRDRKIMNTSVKFCTYIEQPVVCCPLHLLPKIAAVKPTSIAEIDECSTFYNKLSRIKLLMAKECPSKMFANFKHIAQLGWRLPNDTMAANCLGSLISKNYVLTSAFCANMNPEVVQLGSFNTYYYRYSMFNGADRNVASHIRFYDIAGIHLHPGYNSTAKLHDIALIKLKENVTIDGPIVPACLWQNKTHTPIELHSTSLSEDATKIEQNIKITSFDDICDSYNENLHSNNKMCVDSDANTAFSCEQLGAQVQAIVNDNIPYVVGVYNNGDCDKTETSVYTRVSDYVDWIKSVMIEN